MSFIVTGHDYKDDKALERRMDVRQAHMAGVEKMKAKGQILYAAAMLNSKGNMCGSTMILEMDSRTDVETYLKTEPYVLGQVWETVDIVECKVPPLFR